MKNLTSTLEKIRPYFSEGVKIVLSFFLFAAAVIFIFHSALSVAYPYALDYGEAPLIDQATRLSAGENIYRADLSTPPYNIANYPPGYVLTLVPFLNWFDSPFHMGRVISVISTLLSALLIGLMVHHFSQDRMSALVAALFFLAVPYVVGWSGLARIDSLALVLALGALWLLVRQPDSRWAWLGSGLLLVAAIFTRQSYALAAPFAAFVWLWSHNKRRAIELAVLVSGLCLALFYLINWLTGGGFYFNVITANVNEFGWERLSYNLEKLWEDAPIILVMGALFLGIGWRSQKAWFLAAPFLLGAFLSGLTIGKIGSNINYFLELSAALALVAGLMLAWFWQHPWRKILVILLLVVQFGFLMRSAMSDQVDWTLAPRYLEINYIKLLEQEIKDVDGPVLADEHMGLLTMNGRPLYLQPFEVTRLAAAGVWDQTPVLREIAAHKFDLILIHHFDTYPLHKERWTPEMLAAIDEYYRPVKTLSGTVVFVPQLEQASAAVPTPQQNTGEVPQPVWDVVPVLVGDGGFVGEPSLAIDPTDPSHLVAIATRVSKQACDLPNCKVELVLSVSEDGGETWQARATLGKANQVMAHGQVVFEPGGEVYLMGERNGEVMAQRTTLAPDVMPSMASFESATRAQMETHPRLNIDPETGELFLTLDAQEDDAFFVTPSLIRSSNGVQWSALARANLHVSTADINAWRANSLADIQVLFGEGNLVSLVWVWDSEPGSWPRTVWMANSTDGGVTFGEPAPILETWGPINTASANGRYAIVYRVGNENNQKVAVATTMDHGQSWASAVASGDVPLYFDPAKGPGVDIAPNGTLDLVFYAHDAGSLDCVFSVESWQWNRNGFVDSCVYNVYYTYSQDGGLTFADPIQLNQQPIRGADFVRFQGSSLVGTHLVVVSADERAVPIWVGTPETGTTQVYTARIER